MMNRQDSTTFANASAARWSKGELADDVAMAGVSQLAADAGQLFEYGVVGGGHWLLLAR
jgi:hypothetical protein